MENVAGATACSMCDAPHLVDGAWACPTCTAHNAALAAACGTCSTARPHDGGGGSSSGGQGSGGNYALQGATQDAIRAVFEARNHIDALKFQRHNFLELLRGHCTAAQRRKYIEDLHLVTSQIELAQIRVEEFTQVYVALHGFECVCSAV